MKTNSKSSRSGFTLVEMMVTVAMIGIVVAFGIQTMTEISKNDRLTPNVNALIGHLALARSEAVKRSIQVSICVSSNADSADPNCTGGIAWEDGWIVYIDADGNNSRDPGEEVLRAQQAFEGQNRLTPGGGLGTSVTYDYRGFATATGNFLLCDNRTGPHGKFVTITNTGRVRAEGDAAC